MAPATLAYAWLLHKGVTSPIAGVSKASQIDEALAAQDVALSDAELAMLERDYEARSVLGHA